MRMPHLDYGKGGKILSYEQKKSKTGALLILPWFIGFVTFFLIPFIYAFVYSISTVKMTANGIQVDIIGIAPYIKAFTTDVNFLQALSSSLGSMAVQIPMVLVFSMCLALVLNGKFKGRTVIRGIFFIPVIIANGIIVFILNQDVVAGSMMDGSKNASLFQAIEFGSLLLNMGVPESISGIIMRAINGTFTLVWKSGVQTLLLMAGLHSVPKYVYEAVHMDGASAWETFWKITVPMVSPIIALCAFYTVIDVSTDNANLLVRYINEYATRAQMSYSAMLSIIWCAIILFFVAASFFVTKRFVFYENE